MQIYYYQRRDRRANFGDELNRWLWQRLIPDVVSQVDQGVLVGLGTLLNDLLPQRVADADPVFIFSTGVGYEKSLTSIPAHWHLYCVRGPWSARSLGLPADLAITDGGILLRRLVPTDTSETHQSAAFMPHVHHATFAGETWEAICQTAGIRYIDPRWPVEQVLAAIQSSGLLLAEAMHGAITADALGVPWIPIVTSSRILAFKWQDWCASIRCPYRPAYLPPLVDDYPRYARGARSGLRASTHWGRAIAQGHGNPLIASHERAAASLKRLVRDTRPCLSDRAHLENLTQALEEKLLQLQNDAFKLG